MPNLQPISSEKDILDEAARVISPSVNPTIQLVAQQQLTSAPVDSVNNSAAVTTQSAQSVIPANIPTPAPVTMTYRPPVSTVQQVGNTVSINNTPNFYTYALPVTSYVIAWLYAISAVIIGGFLIYFLNLLGQYSKYSSYSTNSSSVTSQYFGSVILPLVLVVIACVAAFIFIRSNTKTSRYITLGIAGLLTAYEIYWATQLFTTSSGMYFTTSTWSMLWAYYSVFIIPFLPYLLLPVATIIYLVTSKAVRAYNRIF